MQLAEYHKIERKLYYSDSINYVHKLLGENRLTRCLSLSTSDETKEGREVWRQQTLFLEKEIRVNQQSSLSTEMKVSNVTQTHQADHSLTILIKATQMNKHAISVELKTTWLKNHAVLRL